ncbi:Hypothetical protein RG1141_CH08960 [Neorhizobium galegae bv. officinalis bv. officinalis str. HAMBI 1141]|uniref:Transmembrane protein n=1 Tax=Neorhizobium galegae bv. officinalis bv. officinalis str. HAMBI 1141 TaxID=1028801 RepID=A0A068T5D3_NEOGA|nr:MULTISPECIES: hypothetical protein [Neorhizobium]MCJ9753135.1 hypothetical protein [Neorhizobium sp. BETTINA12A]CDN53256.1 Hypothetical protein RG1141_CH08960 [Neorhizobium galegae bv. officinalis bv. officinalis str. HAMBI 1141]
MKFTRLALSIIGALLVVLGLIWIGQGSGAFPYPASSFMINQTPWIIRGAIVAIIGVVVIWGARRFLR